jgi:hypothetical protein
VVAVLAFSGCSLVFGCMELVVRRAVRDVSFPRLSALFRSPGKVHQWEIVRLCAVSGWTVLSSSHVVLHSVPLWDVQLGA